MLCEIFSVVRKCVHFIFNYVIILFVCLSLYLFFPKISSILSIIICNPQFYHTYVRLKSAVLPENISTSFFNYILIIFGCLLVYLRFFSKKSQFYQLSDVILNFIVHLLDNYLQFYQKISPLTFSIMF